MRKLATVKQITAINPIPGADAIEVAEVDYGWKVVVKKGEFHVHDFAVYLEVDSWVPNELAPFLTKPGHTPKEYKGVLGQRLKTIKLRGQVSQGLLLPLSVLKGKSVEELPIIKMEKEIPANMSGTVRGNFPTQIPKTDQERVQNIVKTVFANCHRKYEITEKMEGSSMTVYNIDGKLGVCSRNIDLVEDDLNVFWSTAKKYDLPEKVPLNTAIQGELIGPGIQGNIYGLDEHLFLVFDVYDIMQEMYLPPFERQEFVAKLGLLHVPVISIACLSPYENKLDKLLLLADGKSMYGNTLQEGLVFKAMDGGLTFKIISNKYLLKEKD